MRTFIAIVCLTTLLSACGDGDDTNGKNDSCTAGDNMTDPRVAAGFDPQANEPELRVLWEAGTGRGAELPDRYFDNVRFFTEAGMGIVQSVVHSAPRELTVRFDGDGLAAFLETHTELKITLEFGDRTTVLDCTHPGMADAYYLDVFLVIDGGTLASSRTNQRTQLGAI